MRPVILLDVDGPLTMGFFGAACQEMSHEGVFVSPDDLTAWDFFKALGVSHEVEQRVRTRLQRPGVASGFEPNEYAMAFLRDLRRWAEVFAVTSPLDGSATWGFEREVWLADRLGFEPKQVISARDKRLIRGSAFVDDKYAHLVEWREAWPAGLPIMWGCPHNAEDTWTGIRVSTYARLYDYLQALRP